MALKNQFKTNWGRALTRNYINCEQKDTKIGSSDSSVNEKKIVVSI